MLKLEKSESQNSIFQLNYTRYEKKLSYKIIVYIKIFKFGLQHFSIRCIFVLVGRLVVCPASGMPFSAAGDPLLREAWKITKSALRQGIEKNRLQCWKDLIGEVEKDPWGLAFKIVTRLRRKTPGLDNPDRVKYIVRSLFPCVEPFQIQERSSCVVQREELFTLEEIKRAAGRLKANTAPGIDGLPNEILKEVIRAYPEILLKTPVFGRGSFSQTGRNRGWSCCGRATNL